MTSYGWNLPPGVTPGMIPGNRPQDAAWERAYEQAEEEVGGECECQGRGSCAWCVQVQQVAERLLEEWDNRATGPYDTLEEQREAG